MRPWAIGVSWLAAVSVVTGQQATFRATAEGVSVAVSVRDKTGKPVTGLTTGDFDLTDNGIRQEVVTAALDSLPIDVTIVLDTSGSVGGQALRQYKVDVQAMSDLLRPVDHIRLLTFADTVSDVFGLQSPGATLPLDAIRSGGITQLYSALAAALVTASASDRPQLVLAFTDGRDSESFIDVDRVVALAPFSRASLYLVLSDSTGDFEQSTTSHNAPGARVLFMGHGAYAGGPNRSALRTLVQRTGGALYERPAGETLPAIFTRLLGEFRTGYYLTYIPTGVAQPGWHDLHVLTKHPDYAIRARDGYDGG
jgi:VWFA-related protein